MADNKNVKKTSAPRKRKELKKVDKGQVHIQSTFNNTLVTTFKGAFSGAGIETIPAGLFARQVGVTSCSAVFQDCPIGSRPPRPLSPLVSRADSSRR